MQTKNTHTGNHRFDFDEFSEFIGTDQTPLERASSHLQAVDTELEDLNQAINANYRKVEHLTGIDDAKELLRLINFDDQPEPDYTGAKCGLGLNTWEVRLLHLGISEEMRLEVHPVLTELENQLFEGVPMLSLHRANAQERVLQVAFIEGRLPELKEEIAALSAELDLTKQQLAYEYSQSAEEYRWLVGLQFDGEEWVNLLEDDERDSIYAKAMKLTDLENQEYGLKLELIN